MECRKGFKIVLKPIEVPVGKYCCGSSPPSQPYICPHFDGEGYPRCEQGFVFENSKVDGSPLEDEKGVFKAPECMLLWGLR